MSNKNKTKTVSKMSEEEIILQELKKDDFRVTIFGSARIKPNDALYKQIFELAKEIGKHKFDIVTGGGPGLMDAANAGHAAGDPKHDSDSIGLTIRLPWEAEANKHLEIKRHFNKFSGRLDTFMALSNAVVITPGGVGTCLEFFYTWQLLQVKHLKPIPIILLGKMWEEIMEWVSEYPLADGLISPEDTDHIYIAKNNDEVMEIILETYKKNCKNGKCHNNHNYLLEK